MLLALLLAVFLLVITFSLVKALLAITRGDKRVTYQDMFWRMAFTVGLFALSILGWYVGLWQPSAIYGSR